MFEVQSVMVRKVQEIITVASAARKQQEDSIDRLGFIQPRICTQKLLPRHTQGFVSQVIPSSQHLRLPITSLSCPSGLPFRCRSSGDTFLVTFGNLCFFMLPDCVQRQFSNSLLPHCTVHIAKANRKATEFLNVMSSLLHLVLELCELALIQFVCLTSLPLSPIVF